MAGTKATGSYNEAGNTDSARKTIALVTGHVAPSERAKPKVIADHRLSRVSTDGVALTDCTAGMGLGGRLNPDHSRWLMGYPIDWRNSVPTAMP
ncbi:hypothetical protein AN189_18625 [Loktanella sp. 3ANDIMAR09]|nr:hypothetical protein AN189_18625 [Loktanella sp. 3ANDIMAR09]